MQLDEDQYYFLLVAKSNILKRLHGYAACSALMLSGTACNSHKAGSKLPLRALDFFKCKNLEIFEDICSIYIQIKTDMPGIETTTVASLLTRSNSNSSNII
jgi:hypothetical protein